MKKQLTTIVVLALMTLSACQQPAPKAENTEKAAVETPNYAAFDKKVEVLRSFIKAHESENLDAQSALLADTLHWSPPYYNGNEWLGKADYLAILKNYQDNFENITYSIS